MIPCADPELEKVRQRVLAEEAQRRREARRKRWMSPPPERCDLCQTPITTEFMDGKTTLGPWAIMDTACYKKYGVGLGTGLGQHYVQEADGIFYKVAG